VRHKAQGLRLTAFCRYPLATGPEGVTLEGRKMAMAGNRGVVNKRGSMTTLLKDIKMLRT
jgi:hypothetical protein